MRCRSSCSLAAGCWAAVQAMHQIIARGSYRCAHYCGTVRQDQILPGKGTEGLPAKMRDGDGKRLKPGEVFMLVVLSHFSHFASQVCGQLAQARQVFTDVDDRGHPPVLPARQFSLFERREDSMVELQLQILNGH